MEGSLFGAVRATRLFFSAHPTWGSGEAAPGDHRLNLEGGRKKDEGCEVLSVLQLSS